MADGDPLSPVQFDLAVFLTDVARSVTVASRALAAAEAPGDVVAYRIPEVEATVRMSFDYEGKSVKGWLNRKTSTTSQDVESTLTIRLAAVPPRSGLPTGGDETSA